MLFMNRDGQAQPGKPSARVSGKQSTTQAAKQSRPSKQASHALTLTVPTNSRDLEAARHRSRRIVTRRALLSAGAAVVPIPGFDLAVDVNQMLRMIEDVNTEFGLTPMQIERLSTRRKVFAYRAIGVVGSALVGRLMSKEVMVLLLKKIGVRLTAQQASKWVPIAGQAVAAGLSFGALRLIGEQHIADCARVADMLIDVTPHGQAR